MYHSTRRVTWLITASDFTVVYNLHDALSCVKTAPREVSRPTVMSRGHCIALSMALSVRMRITTQSAECQGHVRKEIRKLSPHSRSVATIELDI